MAVIAVSALSEFALENEDVRLNFINANLHIALQSVLTQRNE